MKAIDIFESIFVALFMLLLIGSCAYITVAAFSASIWFGFLALLIDATVATGMIASYLRNQ